MSKEKKLTVLQMNDSHAYIELHKEQFIEGGEKVYRNAGGYARIATIFNNIREKNPQAVLALDNGDTFHGTYAAVKSKGEALIPMMNALQFDGMTGHWDFAYGPKQLQGLVSKLNYPMLANNVYDQETDELVFPAYEIIEKGDVKIGVIGIAEHIVDKMMPAHFSEGIYFTLGNEELPEIIESLRVEDKVDLVVVLSHVGFPQEEKMAREVDGIDILLSGHTHNRLSEPVVVNDTIMIQSGCHSSFIGRLDLVIEDRQVKQFTHELIEVEEEIEPDPKVQAIIDQEMQSHRTMLNTIVGSTAISLDRYAQLETTMDNLLLEAILDVSDATIAFSNGWRYGAPIIPGEITMNDLWNIIPTNPPVSTVELTGVEIKEMMEENIHNTFANDPYEQMGGYIKRCLGMKLFIKLENPKGMRVQQVYIDGELLEDEKLYKAGFVTVQGVPKKYGKNRKHLYIQAIDALKKYIGKEKVIAPKLRQTIEIV